MNLEHNNKISNVIKFFRNNRRLYTINRKIIDYNTSFIKNKNKFTRTKIFKILKKYFRIKF